MKGKSYGEGCAMGQRRKALDASGRLRVLAPRALRKTGRHYMDEIAAEEIAVVCLGINRTDYRAADVEVELMRKAVVEWEARKPEEREGSRPAPSDRANAIVNSVKAFMQLD